MVVMTCKEIQDVMPDLALGLSPVSGENAAHLRDCQACANKLAEVQKTMALLDEWQAPEPSPFFDTRLKARLREEQAKVSVGWLSWIRRPMFAVVATVLIAVSVSISLYRRNTDAQSLQPGTAVSDLQQLDKNHDLYSDFDVLDDLQVQPDVTANP
jgi:negative regulator of sigma E activity